MRQTIYFICAYTIAFLLGISFIYLIISLFQSLPLLATLVLGFFLFSLVLLMTDQELIQEVE